MVEKIRTVIASDKDNVGVRDNLREGIERDGKFDVTKLSRVKTSRIRSEIAPENPRLIVINASLNNKEEIKELRGFINKLRRHNKEAKVVVKGPDVKEKSEIDADGWIDENLPHEYTSSALTIFINN